MTSAPGYTITLWPVAVFFIAVILLVIAMLSVSFVLGQRHRERLTGQPYESGIPSTGTARLRFDIKFYLVAMFFVIFDLESIFIFSWAVAIKEIGWSGYIEILIFVFILVAALFYLWRIGALEWGSSRRIRLAKTGRD